MENSANRLQHNATEQRQTEDRLLGFSYDYGVTVIRHQNADAMVLASVLMRGIQRRRENGVQMAWANPQMDISRHFHVVFDVASSLLNLSNIQNGGRPVGECLS